MIALENVSKRFGAVTAVDRVSFRAEKGKFVVLLGPSGCGKSTLLRLIAGLEEVSEGKILIEGRDVTRLDPTKRRISMVFQSYALFPHLSVAENIVFGLKVRRTAPADRERRLHARRRARRACQHARPQTAAALRRPAPARRARARDRRRRTRSA